MKPKNYWTYDKCKEVALECSTKQELRKKYGTVHNLIYKNDWIELVEHFEKFRKDNGYWIYDNCKEVALKYKNKTKFIKEYYSAYKSIIKNNWIELFEHMKKYEKISELYTYENCKEVISKCKNKSEFITSYYSYYNTILKNNWNELLLYFIENGKYKNYLTYEKCKELSLSCETKKDFIKNYGTAYRKILKNKWNEVMLHLENSNKPKNYWTYERCKEAALYCENRTELYEKYGVASNIIYKNNWYELLPHLSENKKPNGYWTYDKCREVALECASLSELKNKYSTAINLIYKNKWNELISHIKNKQKSKGYWTYEKCKESARECASLSELKNKYGTVINLIYKNNWIELFEHFGELKKPNGYWTYDKCKEVALECNIKGDFQNKYSTAYSTILKNKWIELTIHMENIGNKVKRLIYVYEFEDNNCYIGLTGNIKRRNNQHLGKEDNYISSVYEHILETNIIPKLIIKTDYIDVEDAILMEETILLEYKENNWTILNKVKTGGIGSNDVKWNKDKCREAASKCKNASYFGKNCGGAYNHSAKYGWLDEFFPNTSKKGYWNNKELCREESKKYNNRSEFCQNNWAAYHYSSINEWLDEFFQKNNATI